MRILIISQYFWPENFRINDLAEGLSERGHHIDVLTGLPNYPEGQIFKGYRGFRCLCQDYKGIRVNRIPLIPRGRGGGARLAVNYLSFAVLSSLLAPFLCRDKYDAIFVFEPSPITVALPALLLKKMKSMPVLLWVQDLWPESLEAASSLKSPWVLDNIKRLVRFIYKGCDRILMTSRGYEASILKHGGKGKQLRYFPQCVEPLYRPVATDKCTEEEQVLPKGFRVIFAGNIGAAQSFETILSAAEQLKEHSHIKIIIVGDGRMRSWVETEVAKRDLYQTVYLLGRYPLEAMPRFFSLADALLVSLKSDPLFELTVPGKIQSYLACGRPIIASLDGEASSLVTEANAGLTCAAEDSGALAKAVLTLYNMPEEQRKLMGRNGLEYFQSNFERDRLLERLEKWIYEVVDDLNEHTTKSC